jgi:hypothetical protein
MNKLDFLSSRKFWCLVGLSITSALTQMGYIDPSIAPAIQTFFTGYIGLNVYNNIVEKTYGDTN